MSFQLSETFDPERVLQQVWQGDYPPTWRVFFGPVGSALGCLLVTLQVILGVGALFSLAVGVFGIISQPFSGPDEATALIILGVIILILIGLIVLLQRGVREARRRASQKPRLTMVVTPEGVVEYRRKQTRAIFFAHIAHMQLRVQARSNTITTSSSIVGADGTISSIPSTTTVPAAPAIWLDLVFQNGQRGVWNIYIPPRDAIAQTIIEAYTYYRTRPVL